MGFFKAFKEHIAPTPVGLAELRSDLQECVGDLHPKDRDRFLMWCGGWGAPPDGVDERERYVAVLPVLGDESMPEPRGNLFLTSERLIFRGAGAHLEVPMHQLSVSGCHYHARPANRHLRVGVGPSNNPVHQFRMATREPESCEHFVGALETTVRDYERQRQAGVAARTSVADELTKYARLRDDGVLSESEFQAKKARLLELD